MWLTERDETQLTCRIFFDLSCLRKREAIEHHEELLATADEVYNHRFNSNIDMAEWGRGLLGGVRTPCRHFFVLCGKNLGNGIMKPPQSRKWDHKK